MAALHKDCMDNIFLYVKDPTSTYKLHLSCKANMKHFTRIIRDRLDHQATVKYCDDMEMNLESAKYNPFGLAPRQRYSLEYLVDPGPAHYHSILERKSLICNEISLGWCRHRGESRGTKHVLRRWRPMSVTQGLAICLAWLASPGLTSR